MTLLMILLIFTLFLLACFLAPIAFALGVATCLSIMAWMDKQHVSEP